MKDAIRIERRQAAKEERNLTRTIGCSVGELRTRSLPTSSSSSIRLPTLISKQKSPSLIEIRKPLRVMNSPEEKVRIKDLSWTDKELVLRVLFAKLNESNRKKRQVTISKDHNQGRGKLSGSGPGTGTGTESEFESFQDRDRDVGYENGSPFFVSEGAGDFLPSDFKGFKDSNSSNIYDDNYNDNYNDDDADSDVSDEFGNHSFSATN